MKAGQKEVALFYAREGVGGGSTSFTVHLAEGFRRAGLPFRLFRFTDEPRAPKMLGKYTGIVTEFVTPQQARTIVRHAPSLLVAPEHSKHLPEPTLLPDLIRLGMRIVIHDPNEFKGSKRSVYDHLEDRSIIKRPVAIRPTMKQHFKDALFIPHPYVRHFQGDANCEANWHQRGTACSIARLTFVKRPHIILDANRLLPKDMGIQFHGLENRTYTYFSVLPKYKEFKQGGYSLPFEWGISAVMAARYRFACDFTYFPEDGGGSQYSFMEAWDAGCVNVIHRDWLRYPGEMEHGVNCWAVESAEELATLIHNSYEKPKVAKQMHTIAMNGWQALKPHDAVTIARKYYKELTK